MTTERVCQAPDCDRPIGHLRRQATTCSDPCRLALSKARKRSGVSSRTVSLGAQEGYFEALSADRGYVDWKPQAQTQILIGHVRQILEEYAEHLPLTCRQIYYRMIAEWKYPKGEQFERRLYAALGKARRARMIPFEHIRDDGIVGGGFWPTAPEQETYVWELTAKNYQSDHQEGQPVRIQVWCEAAGMVPQLATVADRYSVPVYSAGGFNSLTAVRQLVNSCVGDTDGATVLIHLGDADPSGYSIFQAFYEDAAAFLEEDRRSPAQTLTAERVAITREQIAEFDLIADEIKTNDSRSKVWRAAGLTHKVEIEALPPSVIGQLLTEALEHHFNPSVMARVRQREAVDRRRLVKAAASAKLTLGYWRAVDESVGSASHEW
jgi:hypothetical protein